MSTPQKSVSITILTRPPNIGAYTGENGFSYVGCLSKC